MDRFVILEHRWNGVHWDLMLQHGAVLRTWALDELPIPGRDVAARALADHRVIYLEYEGPISGDRGTVRRIDTGCYKAREWSKDRVVVELAGSTFRGELELRLNVTPGFAARWLVRLGNVDLSSR